MYLAGISSTDNSEKYKNYLNSAIKYMAKSLVAEIKRLHPDIDEATIDYNDPKWKPIVEKLAYKPTVMGNLAESLGLGDKVLTEEMWNDLFNGWVHESVLPQDSHLRAYLRETPKGLMLPLSNNPGKFDEKGEYVFDGQRRPTNECLFTMGKGLSIWLIAKEMETPGTLKTVQDMHNQVMKEFVIPEMEKHSRIRTMDSGVLTENDAYEICVASFMHIETRGLEPHIHFHDQIVNTAMSRDGRLYSLHTDHIYANKAHYDALYMSAMKRKMEEKFNIEFERIFIKKDATNENLADEEKSVSSYDVAKSIVPEEMIEHYATRSKEILEGLEREGIMNTPAARDLEQKNSREEKSEKSPSELIEIWREEFKNLGYSATNLVGRVLPKKMNYIPITDRQLCKNFQRKHHEQNRARLEAGLTIKSELLVSDSETDANTALRRRISKIRYKLDKKIEDSLSNTFSAKIGKVDFRLQQFKAHVVKQALNTCSYETSWAEAERIAEEQCLLHIPKDRYDYFKPLLEGAPLSAADQKRMNFEFEKEARFITKDVVHMSDYIARSCTERVGEDRWLVDKDFVNKKIREYEKEKGFLLSADQAADVRAAFSEKGSVISTAGMAGAGKSTASEVKVRIWEAMGYSVFGTSIANTATKGLAKSAGMKKGQFHNSAKLLTLLDEGKVKWNDKTVLIFDEAGMADLQTLYRIIKHANDAGAKINFVGEKEQLQPIGPANGFKFLNENFVTMPLTTINRQKKDEMKENVKLWQSGQAKEAIEQLYDWGYVKTPKTNAEAFELVAQLYVDNPKPAYEKIIMSALNSDNDKINSLIKKKLQERGELDSNAQQNSIKCVDGVVREFSQGDRITFFKNVKADDGFKDSIDNSDTGTIKFVRRNRNGAPDLVCIELDSMDPGGKARQLRYINVSRKDAPFRHGWSGTVHKAQGQSKQSSYKVVSHAGHDAFSEYVSASRHKDDYTLIMSEEFKDKALKKLRDKEPSEKQTAKMKWLEKEHGVSVPDGAWETYGEARFFLKDHHDKQMPGANMKTHPLDDFSEIIESFGRQDFKKNVSDYVEIKNGYEILKAMQKERKEDIERFRLIRGSLVPVKLEEAAIAKKAKKAREAEKIAQAERTDKSVVEVAKKKSSKKKKGLTLSL